MLLNSEQTLDNEEPIIDCTAVYESYRFNLRSFNAVTKMQIKTTEGKTYQCESTPRYLNQKRNVHPSLKIAFHNLGPCKPILPSRIGNMLNAEAEYNYDLFANKGFLDIIQFSHPLECVGKAIHLINYFNRLERQ